MKTIDTYYLVDFENVNSVGLSGCDELTTSDHIIIFFTKNAMKINMVDIANHGEADLNMLEVPPGKQSADIHIGSYLGYLSGLNKGKNCSIVVVSKDTDFDNVIKFWIDMTGVKASRRQQIKMPILNSVAKKQPKSIKKKVPKAEEKKKTQLNQEIIKIVREAGFDASIANTVAQITVGFYGEDHLANKVHNNLREKYDDYLDIFNAVKAILAKYDKEEIVISEKKSTSTKKNKEATNKEIKQTLKEAGFEKKIVDFVISTVSLNVKEQKGKQQIYRAIISKYGQQEGLNIYNHIKKCI